MPKLARKVRSSAIDASERYRKNHTKATEILLNDWNKYGEQRGTILRLYAFMDRSDFRDKTVLITGASGFVGSHLCSRLVEEGASVHGLSRQQPSTITEGVNWWHSDLLNAKMIDGIFKRIKPDVIFHLAGYPFGGRQRELIVPALQNNTIATVNVLNSACEVGLPLTIVTGSMEEPEIGEDGITTCSPYAMSKWASTMYARTFHQLYKLPVVMLRVFMVYGPGQKGAHLTKLVPYVVLSLLQRKPPELGSGTREVDWIYVDDVIDALVMAAQCKKAVGEVLDIGSGELHSVKSVVEILLELIDPSIEPRFGLLPDRAFERTVRARLAKTSSILGWRPKTNLRHGLKHTIEWYKSNLRLGIVSHRAD